MTRLAWWLARGLGTGGSGLGADSWREDAAGAGTGLLPPAACFLPPGLQPDHLCRRISLQGVARVYYQAGVFRDGGVIESGVVGYHYHAIGFGGHSVGVFGA